MFKDIINLADDKMNKSIEFLKRDLASMKAGRANPAMLDRIEIDYYGTMSPLNQMSNISIPEPRVLLIQPYDKSSLGDIEKAILKSDLGINPMNDGSVIRLVIPELTEETRKDIVKNVKKAGEETKVAIRGIRRECNDKIKELKKEEDLPEDVVKRAEKEIQNKTDSSIDNIDKVIQEKEEEIMSI